MKENKTLRTLFVKEYIAIEKTKIAIIFTLFTNLTNSNEIPLLLKRM
jgi:hypothetical protein